MVSPVSPATPTAAEEKQRLERHYEKLAVAQRESQMEVTDADAYGYDVHSNGGSSHEAGIAGPSRTAELGAGSGSQPGTPQSPASINRKSLPPYYSGPSSSAHAAAIERQMTRRSTGISDYDPISGRPAPRYTGLPCIDYRIYSPPLFTLSSDKTTLRSNAPYLSASVAALTTLMRQQASVPPKPQIHITGKRNRKVDFAIQLNLMSLLVPENDRRQLSYVRCVGSGELAMRGSASKKPTLLPDPTQFDRTTVNVSNAGSVAARDAAAAGGAGGKGQPLNPGGDALEAWCRLFVEDRASVKEFIMERQVANMDTSWLEGQIRSLVATTGYRGQLHVTFPVTHARVVVSSPDKMNKMFTAMVSLVTGKSTYEVVKAVWPFATHRNGDFDRICAVQSEETWWKEWRDPILYAISTKRRGWVTNEDKLEALMEGVGKGIAQVDWGTELE